MRNGSALVLVLLLVSVPAGATPILINPGAGLAANLPALASFNRAAAEWGSIFSDPITVTVAADLINIPSPNVIDVPE